MASTEMGPGPSRRGGANHDLIRRLELLSVDNLVRGLESRGVQVYTEAQIFGLMYKHHVRPWDMKLAMARAKEFIMIDVGGQGNMAYYNHNSVPQFEPNKAGAFNYSNRIQHGADGAMKTLLNEAAYGSTTLQTTVPGDERARNTGSDPEFNMVVYQPPTQFKPSWPLLGGSRAKSPEMMRRASEVGVDPTGRYQGGISGFNIRNAGCPEHLNCNVRVTGIAKEATNREFFSLLSDGKVFSFNRNPAILGAHSTCAADLCFTTRVAASSFMNRANSHQGIWLHGKQLKVVWNRNRHYPVPASDVTQSRILIVEAPNSSKLSADLIENYLHGFIDFELVDRSEWLLDDQTIHIELAFSSIRGQSRQAMLCLQTNSKGTSLEGLMSVRYGQDPCDPRAAFTSCAD